MVDTEWLYKKGWGVFVHYLYNDMNKSSSVRSMGKETSWDECVNDFDCDLFAKQLNEVGAGYVMFTIMQVDKYMIAPNETFDRITGYKPGEACATADMIEKLYQALAKYDIDLFLYFTGDGPSRDPVASDAFGSIKYGTAPNVSMDFVEKWARVAEEYSIKYGKKIKGWWMDGCYKVIGYDEKKLEVFAKALRAGNPDALLAFNYFGCLDEYGSALKSVRLGTPFCDYTAGELMEFTDIPYGPFIGDQRWHVLSYLSDLHYEDKTKIVMRHTGEELKKYYNKIHVKGGVMTAEVWAFRDGHIYEKQLEVLSHLK